MKMLWRRGVLAAALVLMAAVGGLLAAEPAHAQTVTSGSLTFSGDKTDYITQGESESLSTSNVDQMTVTTTSNDPDGHVMISVNVSTTEWWDLDFGAPGTAVLKPGTYNSATRYPFNTTGPGLNLDGNGRGCNTLTGSFTVIDAIFGPQGYVQKFDATFVQHCEGATAAASGQVHISNPPAPPAPTQGVVSSPGIATTSGPGGSVSGSGNSTGGANTAGGGSAGSRSSAGNSNSAVSANGTGSGDGTISGSGTIAVGNTASTTRRESPVLLVGVGVVAWAVFAAIGLGIGLGMPFRRR